MAYSWPSYSASRAPGPSLSSSPSWRSGFSPSRFTSRCRRASPLLLRAICLAVGVSFAVFATFGSLRYVEARRALEDGQATYALFMLAEAEALFPIEYRNRESSTVLRGSIDAIPPELALIYIDRMLATDPGSAKFQYLGAIQHLRMGDIHAADPYIAAMRRLVPNARELEMVNELYGNVHDRRGGP